MRTFTARSLSGASLLGLLLLVSATACSSSGSKPATTTPSAAGAGASSAAGSVTPGTEPAGPAATSAVVVGSAAAAASIAAGTQQCGSISFAAATPLMADDVVAKHVSCIDAGKVVAGALGKKGGAYEVAPFRCPAAQAHDNAGTYTYSCSDSSGAQVSFTAPDALAISTASAAIS